MGSGSTRGRRAGLVAVGVIALASCDLNAAPGAVDDDVASALGLDAGAGTAQAFALPPDASAPFGVELSLDGEAHALLLHRHSLRAPSHAVHVTGPNGGLRPVAAPPVRTLRGVVTSAPGGAVAGALTAEGLHLLIRMPGGELWQVQPLAPALEGADPSLHAVFRHEDVQMIPGSCAAALPPGVQPPGDAGGGIAGGGPQTALVAFDADHEFYQLNGSSVSATVSDIETLMSMITLIYETEVDVSWQIGDVIVRTSPADPYEATDHMELLDEFRAWWNVNHSTVERDVAHLMTGRDLDGGYIGAAWLGVVCTSSSFAYGLSQSRYTGNFGLRFALTAHELGHNWSAGHCAENCGGSPGDADCAIMCPCIGGCSGQLNLFGAGATSSIVAHRDSVSCMGGNDDPGCPGDLTGDGIIDVDDLVALVLSWGEAGGPADLNADGVVDVADLVELVLAWGDC